jgi:hypothetical protein
MVKQPSCLASHRLSGRGGGECHVLLGGAFVSSTIRIIAPVTIIIAAGLVHGTWTNRLRPSPELTAQAARLQSIPVVIGEWTATEMALPARERAKAGAVSYIARTYTKPGRGGSVSVLLLCGLPGVISTHTPDVCYHGNGYTLEDTSNFARSYGPGEVRAQFRTAVATRNDTNPSVLRIFWSWNDSKRWSAPENARWEFASAPALLKLYVLRETSGAIVDPSSDSINDFLTLFLPEIDRCLFSYRPER